MRSGNGRTFIAVREHMVGRPRFKIRGGFEEYVGIEFPSHHRHLRPFGNGIEQSDITDPFDPADDHHNAIVDRQDLFRQEITHIKNRPKMAMMGREFYPDVFFKAAAYLEAGATYHVFADGDKRTSIAATHYFLRRNGYRLTVSTAQAYTFIMAVAVKKKSMEEIAAWLKKYSVRSK